MTSLVLGILLTQPNMELVLFGNCVTQMTHNEFRPSYNKTIVFSYEDGQGCWSQQLSPLDIIPLVYICLLNVCLSPLDWKLIECNGFILFTAEYPAPRSSDP